MNKKVYHLSHTDLDGYSCQIITDRVFKDIEFFNSNYGEEINQRLTQILNSIKESDFKKNLILITDLNLTLEDAVFLEESIKNIDKDIEILLLDHHKSGEEVAKKYSWYHLDVNRSATKITFDWFKNSGLIDDLREYVECVNAYDIWLVDQEKRFEVGKVLARYVMSAKEINRIMFSKDSFEYIKSMIEEGAKYIGKEDAHIVLDDNLHSIKKKFFIQHDNNTLENLVSEYVVELLTKNKDSMSVYYKGSRGILTYSVGNSSIIGNSFLVKNPEFDFFMDINSRKNISLRANNKLDVSILARDVFDGGGHANASGGRFSEFKDGFIYDDVKRQVEEKFLEFS